ncbi:MAG: hypothetical protein AAGJ40_22050 [Planctomycetota bacterium]
MRSGVKRAAGVVLGLAVGYVCQGSESRVVAQSPVSVTESYAGNDLYYHFTTTEPVFEVAVAWGGALSDLRHVYLLANDDGALTYIATLPEASLATLLVEQGAGDYAVQVRRKSSFVTWSSSSQVVEFASASDAAGVMLGGDTDGDGIADFFDDDDDGDGVLDAFDPFPLDMHDGENVPDPDGDWDGDGVPNIDDPDIDGDGTPNVSDEERYSPTPTTDTDGDGTPDVEDDDDDGDGVPDSEDFTPGGGTLDDPTTDDSDGDGIPDAEDDDDDGDGVLDEDDDDDDGDGVLDEDEGPAVGDECQCGGGLGGGLGGDGFTDIRSGTLNADGGCECDEGEPVLDGSENGSGSDCECIKDAITGAINGYDENGNPKQAEQWTDPYLELAPSPVVDAVPGPDTSGLLYELNEWVGAAPVIGTAPPADLQFDFGVIQATSPLVAAAGSPVDQMRVGVRNVLLLGCAVWAVSQVWSVVKAY